MLDDQHGELMAPVVRGRADRGMPKFTLTDEQIADIAAFVHTFRAAGYDESRLKPPSIVVGDAKAGETFFTAKCGACHSTDGDLRGIATKIADPRLLQQTWLLPGSGGGRGAPPPVQVKPTTVTVTLPSGEKVEGRLDRARRFHGRADARRTARADRSGPTATRRRSRSTIRCSRTGICCARIPTPTSTT